MTALAAWLALVLAVWALARAGRLGERANEAERRLKLLRERQARLEAELARLRGQEDGTPPAVMGTPPAPTVANPPPAPPAWPEDVFTPGPPPQPKPRGPSLWDAAYSRARISVIGGVLVLGGLAFTLRELGAPGWTRLLAVFAFGALLYFNARRVPWPVSGALRGLGYGVTALGVGSLAQALPGGWGPGVTMAGLFALSAALLWDGLRRREPLLGTLAVFGAGLSTWMLTDDLGRWSIVAAGAVLLLAGVAVSGQSAEAAPEEPGGEDGHAPGTALALTLGAAGLVPLGWVVASASHADPELLFGRGEAFARQVLMLWGGVLPGLLAWLALCGLALAPALALLARRGRGDKGGSVPVLAALATVGPQLLVAAAVGTALSGPGRADLPVLGLAGAILAVLALAARHAWWRRLAAGPQDGDTSLAGTLAGSLTAAASGVAGAAALGLLGARTEPVAVSGVALALLLVGLSARSRPWVTAGAWGLGLSALWGAGVAGTSTGDRDTLRATGLAMLPAGVGLLGALRLGRGGWADGGPVLAGVCSALAVLALVSGAPAPLPLWLALVTALLAAGLWALQVRRAASPEEETNPLRRTVYWGLAPGAALGTLYLPLASTPPFTFLGQSSPLACAVALAAATTLLGTARAAGPGLRPVAEVTGLGLLALALCAVKLTWLPGLGVPGALALTAAITAPLGLVWERGRLDVLLGLGGLAALVALVEGLWGGSAVPAPGVLLLGAVWALTRTGGGVRALAGRIPALAPPQRLPVQVLWLAALLVLGLLSLGARLDPSAGGLRPWLALSSLAVLGVGILACVGGHRGAEAGEVGGDPRALWDTGLGLIVAAGLKGTLLDAPAMENSGAAAGVAVLATGLCLLAVAVLAPRPPGAGRRAPQEG